MGEADRSIPRGRGTGSRGAGESAEPTFGNFALLAFPRCLPLLRSRTIGRCRPPGEWHATSAARLLARLGYPSRARVRWGREIHHILGRRKVVWQPGSDPRVWGEAERAHPRRTGTAEVCPSDRQNFFANRLQLSIFAHTIILITVARSLPARLCSSCSVSATGLALGSRATELELRKSKTPGLSSEGFVSRCRSRLRAREMEEPSM